MPGCFRLWVGRTLIHATPPVTRNLDEQPQLFATKRGSLKIYSNPNHLRVYLKVYLIFDIRFNASSVIKVHAAFHHTRTGVESEITSITYTGPSKVIIYSYLYSFSWPYKKVNDGKYTIWISFLYAVQYTKKPFRYSQIKFKGDTFGSSFFNILH